MYARAVRSLRRATFRFLKGSSPELVAWIPRLLCLTCLLVVALLLLLLSPQRSELRASAAAAHTNLTSELLDDFHRHNAAHWRMLLPGQHHSFEAFLVDVTDGLRARSFGGRTCLAEFIERLAPQLDRQSLWLEFGVWMGHSIGLLGKRSQELGRTHKVFGFDSFQGLPESWRNSTLGDKWAKKWTQKGSFDLGGEAPEWFVDMKTVEFVKGWFNESLPPFLNREPGPVSFVHVDSDLYSSAVFVLRQVTHRLVSGAVIVFDELINYPGFREGEMLALYEWLQSPEFRDSALTGVQIVGYRGPNLIIGDEELSVLITEQRGEGRKYPQDALFRVW